MRSSSSESDSTYDSSCSENSSDRRRLSSSAARRRSRSERSNRCRRRQSTRLAPSISSATLIVAYTRVYGRNWSMDIYIQRSTLRINLVLCLSLAACDGEARPGIARVWPALGTMMSAAAWGADSARVVRALDAAHDSVERIDALLRRRVSVVAIDAMRREVRRTSDVALPP